MLNVDITKLRVKQRLKLELGSRSSCKILTSLLVCWLASPSLATAEPPPALPVAPMQCLHPDEPTTCVQRLRRGEIAPFEGQLLPHRRAAELVLAEALAEQRQRAAVAAALELVEIDHRKQIDLMKLTIAEERQRVVDARAETAEILAALIEERESTPSTTFVIVVTALTTAAAILTPVILVSL